MAERDPESDLVANPLADSAASRMEDGEDSSKHTFAKLTEAPTNW